MRQNNWNKNNIEIEMTWEYKRYGNDIEIETT